MSTKRITIKLFDEKAPDDQRFFRLFDSYRWDQLVESIKEDGSKTLNQLLEEMLEGQ